MLILTRKPGQSLVIELAKDVDPQTPVGELFAGGPIEIMVCGYRGDAVRIGVNADPRFRILRDEVREEPAWYGVAESLELAAVD